MDSVNGAYMICPTINCYYLMYLRYLTLLGIVKQDHNPLLLDDPYLGKPCSNWMGEPASLQNSIIYISICNMHTMHTYVSYV